MWQSLAGFAFFGFAAMVGYWSGRRMWSDIEADVAWRLRPDVRLDVIRPGPPDPGEWIEDRRLCDPEPVRYPITPQDSPPQDRPDHKETHHG